jgi:biotin carboxyl carrier protein
MRGVCALGEVGRGDRAAVGGKGAGLGELSRLGIQVPTGYVVTVAAFERALQALDPAGEIRREIEELPADDTAAITEVSGRARARIAAAELPGELREQIIGRYRELGGELAAAASRGEKRGGPERGAAVAVRSSATGEDAAEASFAGLQDTYLCVRGEQDLIDHVRRCWASLYNAEAVGYRRRFGMAERDLAMAVVVQRMVEPRCAGVMFTCSPTTGDRSVISVEACWGLGSALVSGDVTPDRFVISSGRSPSARASCYCRAGPRRCGPGAAPAPSPRPGQGRLTTCSSSSAGSTRSPVRSADVDLTSDDVQDILNLLDGLPYGEMHLQTGRFSLWLRRTPDGEWTQEVQVRSEPNMTPAAAETVVAATTDEAAEVGGAGTADEAATANEASRAGEGVAPDGMRAVRAPLPGTFYRAPMPGAPPFVDTGSHVEPDTVVAIIETMKLMNSVSAGVSGTVARILLADAQPAGKDAALMWIREDT